MLANGSSLSTVDELTIEDAKALYVTLQGGLWGPYGEARSVYTLYCSQHLQKEVAVAVASGKKYNATPAAQFHEMFPIVEDFHSLGEGEANRVKVKEDNLAQQMLSVLPQAGAPAWLLEASK
jgi:hypothetical protein